MKMTPTEIKSARQRLGFSQRELAEALYLSDARIVRMWEAGDRDPSGPVVKAIELMIERLEASPTS